jgi:hypothetical protein
LIQAGTSALRFIPSTSGAAKPADSYEISDKGSSSSEVSLALRNTNHGSVKVRCGKTRDKLFVHVFCCNKLFSHVACCNKLFVHVACCNMLFVAR